MWKCIGVKNLNTSIHFYCSPSLPHGIIYDEPKDNVLKQTRGLNLKSVSLRIFIHILCSRSPVMTVTEGSEASSHRKRQFEKQLISKSGFSK